MHHQAICAGHREGEGLSFEQRKEASARVDLDKATRSPSRLYEDDIHCSSATAISYPTMPSKPICRNSDCGRVKS